MANTSQSESERLKLLPSVYGLGASARESGNTSAEEGDRDTMTQQSHAQLLLPILAILLIPIIWLASTGFVVVPPGELAVIVTLVRRFDVMMYSMHRAPILIGCDVHRYILYYFISNLSYSFNIGPCRCV